MNSKIGRPPMAEAGALGLVATGAVSIGIASVVGAIGAGIEIFRSQSLVSLETLDAGTRWLLLAEVALPALATVIVCAALLWLGLSLIRQRAFRRSMVPVLATAALVATAFEVGQRLQRETEGLV